MTARHLVPLLPLVALGALPLVSGADATGWSISPDTLTLTLGDGGTYTEAKTVHMDAGAVTPMVDVYILADTTGSMGGAIGGVQAGATSLVTSLLGMTGVDLAIGIGNYKDFPYDSYAFDHQLSFSSDGSNVTSAINAWYAWGGADGSEGQFYALDRIAADADPAGGAIGWRDGAKRIVVWFGDWPAHDPVCSAISGLGYDITEASVTADLEDAGIAVLAISTTAYMGWWWLGLDDDPASDAYNYTPYCGEPGGTSGQATRIAAATGGSHTTFTDYTTIAAAIGTLITAEVETVDELVLQASGDIAPYVTDVAPASYTAITTDEAQDFAFDVTYTGDCSDLDETTTFTGTVDAVADGAVVASQTVTLTVSCGCEAPVVGGGTTEMWSPNHAYWSFDLSDCGAWVTGEDCDGTPFDIDADGVITAIWSDEPEDAHGGGDGATLEDIVIDGPSAFSLRAERQGGGNGRVYTVAFTVTNSAGDADDGTCTVTVPHDGSGTGATDDGSGAGYTVTY